MSVSHSCNFRRTPCFRNRVSAVSYRTQSCRAPPRIACQTVRKVAYAYYVSFSIFPPGLPGPRFLAKSDKEPSMAKNPSRPAGNSLPVGQNGHGIHNEILLSLSAKECAAVFANLDFVELPTG